MYALFHVFILHKFEDNVGDVYKRQHHMLTASGSTASGTDQTAFLIDQSFITAIRAFLSFGFRSVLNIFLHCTFYTVLPSVDADVYKRQMYTWNMLPG